MPNKYKIAIILILSVAFGMGQAWIMENPFIDQSLMSALIPIILTLIISLLIEIPKTIFKKGYKFNGFLNTSWVAFIFIISLCFVSILVNSYNKTKEANSNSETYKGTVQKNNPEPIKKVGEVNTEFLNTDNLYENYSHHYSITFPANFKVNYGIGKHSEVQAYDKDSANTIIVNVAESNVSRHFSSSQTPNEISEIMVRGIFEKYKNKESATTLENSLMDRGLTDVELYEANLTNFNNRFFIDSRYYANAIIDNQKYPVVLIDYVTFYDNHVYHFSFRSWKNLYNNAWQSQIKTTMSTVLINENITNNK